jgi:hypothetical protein
MDSNLYSYLCVAFNNISVSISLIYLDISWSIEELLLSCAVNKKYIRGNRARRKYTRNDFPVCNLIFP